MSKKLKIMIAVLIMVLLSAFFIGMAFILNNFLTFLFWPPQGHLLRGDLLATSVSPEDRWRVRVYFIAVGALGSGDRYYAEVTDLRNRMPTHEIDLPPSTYYAGYFRWKSANTVEIAGLETDVLRGTVLRGTLVSPDGRWNVKVYERFPIGRRYGYTYAKVIDQTGKTPNRDIVIEPDKIDSGGRMRWKNAHIIDIYGQEVDVTKNSD